MEELPHNGPDLNLEDTGGPSLGHEQVGARLAGLRRPFGTSANATTTRGSGMSAVQLSDKWVNVGIGC